MSLFPVRCHHCARILGHLEKKIKTMMCMTPPDERSWANVCIALGLAPECCGLTLASMSHHYAYEEMYLEANTWCAPSDTSHQRIHYHHLNQTPSDHEQDVQLDWTPWKYSNVDKEPYRVYSSGMAQPISHLLSSSTPPLVRSSLTQ